MGFICTLEDLEGAVEAEMIDAVVEYRQTGAIAEEVIKEGAKVVVEARKNKIDELLIELRIWTQSQPSLEGSELAYSAGDVVGVELDVWGLAWRP